MGRLFQMLGSQSSRTLARLGIIAERESGFAIGLVGRYLITSAVNVVNHQIVLQLAVRWWGWSGGIANVFAALVAMVPAYLLSRYWVWQVDGRPSLRNEIVPFWAISALGLVASSVTAELADRAFDEALMISVGSLVGYLLVWILKFIVLNVMFRHSSDRSDSELVRA